MMLMRWEKCEICKVEYPRPALTKDMICYHCSPPYIVRSD